MTFLSDNILDGALQYVRDHGGRIDICSQEPANYTEATSTYTLGNKTSPTVGAQVNGDVSGRKVEIAAFSDGSVTATGTASHQALSKTTATTELLAARALAASQGVTNLNTFTFTAWDIEFPDPA